MEPEATRALLRHGFEWAVVAFSSLAAVFQGYLFVLLSIGQRLGEESVAAPSRVTSPLPEGVPEGVLELANVLIMGGILAGTAWSGFLSYHLGRRSTVVLAARIGVLASLLSAAVFLHKSLYLIGRALSGVAAGTFSVAVPMYISELAPAAVRGRLLVSYQLAFQLGGLSAYLVIRSILQPTCIDANGTQKLKWGHRDWTLQLGLQGCVKQNSDLLPRATISSDFAVGAVACKAHSVSLRTSSQGPCSLSGRCAPLSAGVATLALTAR